MNAKELIEAATRLREEYGNWKYVEAGSLYGRDVIMSCAHILSTVREDDDEPVTREWLASIGADIDTDAFRSYIRYAIRQRGDEQLIMTLFVSGGQVFLNDRIIAFAETRGKFRSLLRGLRVPTNK